MGTPVMPRRSDDGGSEGEDSEDAEEQRLLQRELSIAWVPPSKDIANFAFVRQHYHHEVIEPNQCSAADEIFCFCFEMM
jgi:hypothetical protein